MRTRSPASGSVWHADGPQESGVRVRSNLPHFLVRTSFERVGEHEHAHARMAVVRGHAVRERLELLGDDDDRGFLERLDADGVVDTPRRAGPSVAQADDAALHEPRPVVDVGARLLSLRSGTVAGPEHAYVGAVGAQEALPDFDDCEVRAPRLVDAETNHDALDGPVERPRA